MIGSDFENYIWRVDIAKFERMRSIIENGCSETMKRFATKAIGIEVLQEDTASTWVRERLSQLLPKQT